MADRSKIEWTDASLFGEPLPRRCRACGAVKPIANFKIDRSRNDGHGYVCRACERLTPVEIPNNPERAEARERGVAWCSRCSEWKPLRDMAGNGLCKVHQREADRARYAADPVFRARRQGRGLARRRSVAVMPPHARELIGELFEGRCAYCPEPGTTWDHFIPVSRGGQTEAGNMVPACGSCNSKKRNKEPSGFIKTLSDPHPYLVEYVAVMGVL